MEDTAKSSGAPPRERWAQNFENNVTEMRDAARWAIGVVAGLLLAATSLSGFGRLYPNDWRFWLAAAAAAVTVVAVGTIVNMFLRIQVSEPEIVESLSQEEIDLPRKHGLLLDFDSFETFRRHHDEVIAEYREVRASVGRTALHLPEQYRTEVLSKQQDLSDELEGMAWTLREIEALIAWRPARERFQRARKALIWLGLVAAFAAMTLVWSVNPPEPRLHPVVVTPTSATSP